MLPQPLGHGHPVHGAHFDVQQQNVIVAFLSVTEQEALGGGEVVDMHRVTTFRRPAGHHIPNILPICVGIIANRNFVVHAPSSPSCCYLVL